LNLVIPNNPAPLGTFSETGVALMDGVCVIRSRCSHGTSGNSAEQPFSVAGDLPEIIIDFGVTVAGGPVVTLSWTAPTENEDGTPLTDLDGYRIYEGVRGGPHTAIDQVAAEFTAYFALPQLAGETCWVVTAFDFSENETVNSNEACMTT